VAAVIVELAARKFTLPYECPCCGAPPDTEVSARSSSGHGLLFPYCEKCLAHVRKWEASGVASAGIMVVAILVALVVAVVTSLLYGLVGFVVAAVLAWWLRSARRSAATAACGVSCAAPGLAVAYLGWSGATTSFSFASPTFAARFAEANSSIVAHESPQLRKLLEGYKRARLAVPTPAVAAGVAPPPLTASEWNTRIEATTGTLARRIALSRALEMIEEPQARRELIQTVAQLELAPVLDRLQRTTGPVARRAVLATAIADVAGDNLSDELQRAILDKLQARVAELS